MSKYFDFLEAGIDEKVVKCQKKLNYERSIKNDQ